MTGIPTTMRAAVLTGPGRLEVTERAVPEPGPDQVLVEVSHCGICGSDLHFVLEGWGAPGMVPGHEWSGRVVATGEGVTGWRPGDAVVGGPEATCGACGACRAGRANLCAARHTPGTVASQGALAEYVCVPESALVRVPGNLSLRSAALAEPLAVALHALTRSGVVPGQRAFVSGAGPIGVLVVAALDAMGVDDVVVSEPVAPRRELARKLGAAEVLEPGDLDVASMAEPHRIVAGASDVAFECSGRAAGIQAALSQLARGGTLVIVGAGMEAASVDPNRVLLNELTITGSFEYDAGGVSRAVELLAGGALPVDVLVEPDDVALDGVLDAMGRLASGAVAGKVLVAPETAAGTAEGTGRA